jgi:hypothetical protein
MKNMSVDDYVNKYANISSYYTDFLIKPSINYQESFGNTVKDSAMAGMFNQMSEMSKEIQFVMNTSQLISEQTLKESKAAARETLEKGANTLGSAFVNRFLKGATSVLSGTNIVFPQIWNNSTFSKSYSIEIPLYTPYGSIKNIYMDILVPTWFWIALAAPHQASTNSYSAPFMLRCHVPGIFSVDMGMVESLSIHKGVDNEWSVDGFPMAVNLQINIVDLYQQIYLSRINGVSPTDIFNFLENSALIDYVCVNSGIDMKSAEWNTKMEVAKALGGNALRGLGTRIGKQMAESNASKIRNMSNKAGIGLAMARDIGSSITNAVSNIL